MPCPHGAGNSATSALAIPAVAAVVKLPVAEAVAMLHSVHSPRLWRLRLQYRYHTHTSFVSRRDKGKGSDANDDYSNDAAWHPAPSRTLQFGTPREGSKTAKKGTSNSRLLFCRTAHGELCVQWHFLVQTCECWRPSACHAQRVCSLRGVSFPKRHARPPPMVQAVALLLP